MNGVGVEMVSAKSREVRGQWDRWGVRRATRRSGRHREHKHFWRKHSFDVADCMNQLCNADGRVKKRNDVRARSCSRRSGVEIFSNSMRCRHDKAGQSVESGNAGSESRVHNRVLQQQHAFWRR